MTHLSKYALVFALIACMLLPMVAAATVDVTITVIDKEGDEIEDATIDIWNLTDDGDKDEKICDGTTDDKGEVDCDGADALDDNVDHRIEVTHDNYKDFDNENRMQSNDLDDLSDDDIIAVVLRPKEKDLDVTVVDQSDDEVKGVDLTIESLDKDLDEGDFDSDYELILFPDEKSEYKGFEVDSSDEEGETNSNGEATFENLEYNTKYKITLDKSGFTSTFVDYSYKNFDFDDTLKDQEVDVEFQQPGEATFTAIVRDQETNDFISGAKVTVVSKTDAGSKDENSGSDGQAEITLDTPDCFDVAVTKSGYSTDSQTNMCLENDDDVTSPFYLLSQNNAPEADAGEDQYVMVGDEITLDASGSSDPDDDDLTYDWEDSLDVDIEDVEKPELVFALAGEHVLTLTVSDGDTTSTDEVTIVVESPENCGDAVCSLSEASAETCPQDCPVCDDGICGAGEADSSQEGFYCPIDCNADSSFDIDLDLENKTDLVPGNKTKLTVRDPETGEPLVGRNAVITVTAPDGTVTELTTTMGAADYKFEEAGKYTIKMSADDYPTTTTKLEVNAPSDFGPILMWAGIIIVIILLALFVIRYINLRKGGESGGKGYRAKKYRKGKATLSSI